MTDLVSRAFTRLIQNPCLPHGTDQAILSARAGPLCQPGLMHQRGVPLAVIAAWLGHTDASFTLRTYAHSSPSALAEAAATLGSLVTSRDTSDEKKSDTPAG